MPSGAVWVLSNYGKKSMVLEMIERQGLAELQILISNYCKDIIFQTNIISFHPPPTECCQIQMKNNFSVYFSLEAIALLCLYRHF